MLGKIFIININAILIQIIYIIIINDILQDVTFIHKSIDYFLIDILREGR